jgi:hypothetical protein
MGPSILSPGEFARLLLGAEGGPPRARARDQQADVAGARLRHQVLERLAAIDPSPDHLDEALLAIASEMGQPSGPPRAAALSVRQEWEQLQAQPGLASFLAAEALTRDDREGKPRRRRRDDDAEMAR